MKTLALGVLLALAAPAAADDGACVVPLHVSQRWEGHQIMVSLIVELQSPGTLYACPDLPDYMGAARVVLRRQLPAEFAALGPDPVIDTCVTYLDLGTHPVDGFARLQLRDTAGSYQCVTGPDDAGEWTMVPARRQVFQLTWYLTP